MPQMGPITLPNLFIYAFSLVLSSIPDHDYSPPLPPGSHWGHSLF